MEAMVKKYQQKFKRVKDDMDRWDDFQTRLISQFINASSIIGRLQLLEDPKNYGSLKNVDNIKDAILTKQMESLQMIMLSMTKTLEELNSVVLSLAKSLRDAKQQVKGGSVQISMKQLNQRIGIKPSLADCIQGLQLLHEMYQSEYMLKSSLISSLSTLALKPSVSDLQAFEQLLVDQPNIPKEEGDVGPGRICEPRPAKAGPLVAPTNHDQPELVALTNHDLVQSIYDVIFAEEIC